MSTTEIALASIRARLDRHFSDAPYLPDAPLAQTLGMTRKTLPNHRSLDPGRYPRPRKLRGGRTRAQPRVDLISWLAQAERAAMARIVHGCR